MTRVRVKIYGRVQGVWFRQSTANEANRLGLAGWVRNCADSSVEAVFEGNTKDIEAMLSWCAKGPPLARVAKIERAEEIPEGIPPPFKVAR